MSADKIFNLQQKCAAATENAVSLWIEIVDLARTQVSKGGGDSRIVSAGMKAAENIVAYAHGLPTHKFEHSGVNGEPIKHQLDTSKLSTQALKELIAARNDI